MSTATTTPRHTQIAVLMRTAQWVLDEAAFAIGGGRPHEVNFESLASALEQIVGLIREDYLLISSPPDDVPSTVDGQVTSA